MTQSPNQFSQTPEKGDLDLKYPGGVISGIVASTQSAALVPGQAVRIADVAGSLPQFISLAAEATEATGFAVRNIKDAEYAAGDRLEVAIAGSVQFMEAAAAIARGARVEVEATGDKVRTSAGTNPIVGWALDKAAADGDIIRVYIQTPGETPAA